MSNEGKKSVIFYTESLCDTSVNQSLASLMASLCNNGTRVCLVTPESPDGNDFATAPEVERMPLNQLTDDGISAFEASKKFLAPNRESAVILWGRFSETMLQFFIAAYQYSIPCLSFITDSSAYEKPAFLRMAKGCCNNYFPYLKDAESVSGQGIKAELMPFFNPYSEDETDIYSVLDGKLCIYIYSSDNGTFDIIRKTDAYCRERGLSKSECIIMDCVPYGEANNIVSFCNENTSFIPKRKLPRPLSELRKAKASVVYSADERLPNAYVEGVCHGVPSCMFTNASDVDSFADGSSFENRETVCAKWLNAVKFASHAPGINYSDLIIIPKKFNFGNFLYLKGKKRLNKRKVSEISSSDSEKLRMLVLLIYLEFAEICRRHNLTHYIAGGTLLGAIRHKGFIPWDDDIDVTMPREDYNKFLEIAQNELPDWLKCDLDCRPFCHHRIEIKGTVFNSFWRNGGVFLDILALDGSPSDEKLLSSHEKAAFFWRSCLLEKDRKMPLFDFSSKKKILRYIVWIILRFVPHKFFRKKWIKNAEKYSVSDSDYLVCMPASIYTYRQERFPKGFWGEPVYVDFEGIKVPTMQHWNEYLTCHFGDYMKLPPLTLRKSHHFVYGFNLGKFGKMSVSEIYAVLEERKFRFNQEN